MSGDDWKTAKLPTVYSRALKALAECATVDGCKEWKVQADMVASYARQYHDQSLLEDAYKIRNRAKRRMGEILAGHDRIQGVSIPRGDKSTVGRTAVASKAGISEYDRKSAMRLAAMPQEEFDRREKEPGLGQQKGKPIPGTIRCPHCGGVIVL